MTKPAEAGHNIEIQGIIKRMLAIMTEQDTLAEDLKELKAEAKGKGIDSKALSIAIKEHRNPVEQNTKNLANVYFSNSGGQYDIFA